MGCVGVIKKENVFQKYVALILSVLAVAYLWFYDLYFEPNPLYGDRCSTASNVGRDHWAAFIVWGFLLWITLAVNVMYGCKKFGVKTKYPKLLMACSFLGTVGLTMGKNEKLKRFTFTLTYSEYTGETYTVDYKDQILVSSKELINGFLSKKSLHSCFSIIFAGFAAAAVLYIIICKLRESKKWKILTGAFAVFCVAAATFLKLYLSGTTELIAITVFFVGMMLVNFTNIMEDKAPKLKNE